MPSPPISSSISSWRTPLVIITAGCLIAMIGFGTRSIFGLFLEPMTVANGWSRETFALALAIQNLLWGLGSIGAGMLADRYGPVKVIACGGVFYGLGIFGMTQAESGLALYLTAGVLTGLGVAFTAFSLALAAMARVVSPQKRSLVFGLCTAAGSLGQVVFSPVSMGFIVAFGWSDALLIFAAFSLVMIPLAMILPDGPSAVSDGSARQSMGFALREAMAHRGYVLLTLGFFVCGFHVAFIAVHFPAYVKDLGLNPNIGAYALSLVGLFNIIGAFMAGVIGQRWSKKNSLSIIYFLRALVILALLMMPKTALTIYLFAGAMGLLWLSTVPLTTSIVAQVFGLRYMATLFSIVFMSHQLGSFLGVWLGGRLFDLYGSYDPIWWAGIALGIFAGIVHLPIDEKPLVRLSPAPAMT